MGKRFAELGRETPVEQAGWKVLRRAIVSVRRHAKLARLEGGENVEVVHQLRVSTRRASAALRVFEDDLPASVVRGLTDRLKELRGSAGAVRDLDVLIIDLNRLREHLPDEERKAVDVCLQSSVREREKSWEQLHKTLCKLRKHEFWRWCRRNVVNKLPAGHEQNGVHHTNGNVDHVPGVVYDDSMGAAARSALASNLKKLYKRFKNVEAGNFDSLHQVRIAGKRLRYAMDIFAGCFDEAFQTDYYAPVKKMQDVLGSINDAHNFLQRLKRHSEKVSEKDQELCIGFSRLIVKYQTRLELACNEFQEHWHETLGDSYRRRFLEVLDGIHVVAST